MTHGVWYGRGFTVGVLGLPDPTEVNNVSDTYVFDGSCCFGSTGDGAH